MRGDRLLRRTAVPLIAPRTRSGVPAGLPTCAPPDRASGSVPGAWLARSGPCPRAPARRRGCAARRGVPFIARRARGGALREHPSVQGNACSQTGDPHLVRPVHYRTGPGAEPARLIGVAEPAERPGEAARLHVPPPAGGRAALRGPGAVGADPAGPRVRP